MNVIPTKVVNSTYGPMIINAHDQYIGRSIEQVGFWGQDEIDLIKSIVDVLLLDAPCIKFYDIGANIGTHTVAMSKLFGDKISIRAFEAQRQVYYMLCGNVVLNGLDNVECEHVAVSNGDEYAINMDLPDYRRPNNFGGLELQQPVISDNQNMTLCGSEVVECVTIDQFDEPVHFIKMDIEGMEDRALAGGIKTLTKYRPVCFIEMFKTDIDKVKLIFKKLDYVAYMYTHDNWIFLPSETDVSINNASKIEL